jgi:hypothetical protein
MKIPELVDPFKIKNKPKGIKIIPAPKKGNMEKKNVAINQIEELLIPMIKNPIQASKPCANATKGIPRALDKTDS